MSRRLFAIAALLAAPLPAVAQSDLAQHDAAETPQVIIPAESIIDEGDFRDLRIDGVLVGPGLPMVSERQPAPVMPWFQLRRDFTPEMSASIDDVR